MTEILDKYREEAKEVAIATHGAARDDKDTRHDKLTAQLLDMFQDLHRDVMAHMKDEHETLRAVQTSVNKLEEKSDLFLSAFPNKNPVDHREYHESLITIVNDKAAFWARMRWYLIEAGIFSFLAWAGYQLWRAFLMGPK